MACNMHPMHNKVLPVKKSTLICTTLGISGTLMVPLIIDFERHDNVKKLFNNWLPGISMLLLDIVSDMTDTKLHLKMDHIIQSKQMFKVLQQHAII